MRSCAAAGATFDSSFTTSSTWSVTVPDHKEIKRGTLRGILASVSEATGLDVPTLVDALNRHT
jgi:hypothetical protein